MPDITIPDAAVEAAAQVYFGEYGPSINWNSPSMSEEERDTWRNEMAAYLLAAAPHIAAQALRDAAEQIECQHVGSCLVVGNDYCNTPEDGSMVRSAMIARAARIEADHG